MANALNVNFDSGFGSIGNVWNVGSPSNGQVTLSGTSGMMEWASGPSAGHGYGTYTVTAKVDGNQPGPGIVLWPGNDQWPGQEIDMVEITPDGSGRQYGTVHWNSNGSDAFDTRIYDGVQSGVFHDYTMVWEPGKITFKVDGAVKGVITDHVPVDFDHGGMNNTIGVLNTSNATSITVDHISFTPLGGSTPQPVQTVTTDLPAPVAATVAATSTVSVGLDWQALAAEVTANYEATGHWVLPTDGIAPSASTATNVVHDGAVDWNVIAATVIENYETTGHWFM
ncbi:family 16 glycosylhydrolase [Belnapia sp. T6]|uniref:Family 16 glycosylhydrolase n=1 Tax=Belnapia mucosa TaxID=2804532 RepID=A0ABS1V6D5_9PROT|nr:family 16 glycosylhydrolase [Belnapia mucosa]MBL6457239.1 family 16 glycosylhydrolase [Belnapia mucosa]